MPCRARREFEADRAGFAWVQGRAARPAVEAERGGESGLRDRFRLNLTHVRDGHGRGFRAADRDFPEVEGGSREERGTFADSGNGERRGLRAGSVVVEKLDDGIERPRRARNEFDRNGAVRVNKGGAGSAVIEEVGAGKVIPMNTGRRLPPEVTDRENFRGARTEDYVAETVSGRLEDKLRGFGCSSDELNRDRLLGKTVEVSDREILGENSGNIGFKSQIDLAARTR